MTVTDLAPETTAIAATTDTGLTAATAPTPAPRTIVIAATPTPNGDLHVGHLAGPYLAGGIYTRYLRAKGQSVTYATCTDDNQTYVVSTARKHNTTPDRLSAESTGKIQRSFEAMGITIAPLPSTDAEYRDAVLDFLLPLYQAGKFETRTVSFPYDERAGIYLFDGLVKGECPVCLAESCGGGCEGCGHPNHFDQLGRPRSVLNPGNPVGSREATVLVLPLERYREQLTAYYAARRDTWRPHSIQLIDELLAGPLPEVPVTVPDPGWGIPAPFAPAGGQIVYPWLEAMPASIHATRSARTAAAADPEPWDSSWRAESGNHLVYFHGFDNVYFWGLVDLVMLLAHDGRYIVPEANICNEFYELEHEKFSTSRNHLIWSADLVAEVPRDLVRFYLALTGPEHQRTNFSRADLSTVVDSRLVKPWNVVADTLTRMLYPHSPARPLKVSEPGRARAAALAGRFRLCYELASFSPARAADTLVVQLARLVGEVDRLAAEAAGEPEPVELGDLLLSVRTLLACAAPILIDVAERLRGEGVDLALDAYRCCDTVDVFHLPRLTAIGAASARTRSKG